MLFRRFLYTHFKARYTCLYIGQINPCKIHITIELEMTKRKCSPARGMCRIVYNCIYILQSFIIIVGLDRANSFSRNQLHVLIVTDQSCQRTLDTKRWNAATWRVNFQNCRLLLVRRGLSGFRVIYHFSG